MSTVESTFERGNAGTRFIRAETLSAAPAKVDRANAVIYGKVIAELGPFKSPGRGEFDMVALEKIVELGNAKATGLKSRFTHPDLSSDGLGKFLGRDRNFRLEGTKVKADSYLDKTSLEPSPNGGGKPLGIYVMDLAESDPGAFSSSLVLETEKEFRLEPDGTKKKGPDGNALPPLWRPKSLHASDVVDTGDAVNDFLSADIEVEGLPDVVVRRAAFLMDEQFSGQPRETVADRCHAFVDRYLSRRFGDPEMSTENKPAQTSTPDTAKLQADVATLAASLAETNKTLDTLAKSLSEANETAKKERQSALRSKEIASLCQMAGDSNAATYIADESLTVESLRATLFAKLCKDRQLTGDGGTTGDIPDKGDPNSKFKKEYQAKKDIHDKLGITEADFVALRRQEEGLDPQVDLLATAAERSTKKAA